MIAITKNQFGVDEIHEVRRKLAEEKSLMSLEEFNSKYDPEIEKVRLQIENIRRQNQQQELLRA